jgi:hypothetical protein
MARSVDGGEGAPGSDNTLSWSARIDRHHVPLAGGARSIDGPSRGARSGMGLSTMPRLSIVHTPA